MAVQSKLLQPDGEFISFFDSIPYTCYEVGHTWTPSCTKATLGIIRPAFTFSLKLYTTFYVATFLLKLQKKEKRNVKELIKLVRDILQSSVFLCLNGIFFLGGFCVLRRIIGKFYGWNGYLLGFLVGYVCIGIERKSRRGMLALYLANLATETLFKMVVARNMVTPIRYGEVIVFSIASAGFMSLFRMRDGLSKNLETPFSYIIGKGESGNIAAIEPAKRSKVLLLKEFSKLIAPISKWIQHLHPKHSTCPHQGSCLHYALEGTLKRFLLGYAVEISINLLQLLRGRRKFLQVFKNTSLGLFLGGYNALFRLCNCLLRWLFNKDIPSVYGAISGLIAGGSFMFYRSSTIALYFLFKLIEVLSFKAIDKGLLPHLPYADKLLYAISLAVVLQAACVEPHSIRPAYWKFLIGVSGGRFPEMFRELFNAFGTKASTLYPNFTPNLDPKFVRSPEVIELMIARGKWK